MILNDQGYEITMASCEKFKQALRDLRREAPLDENAKGLHKAQEDAIKSKILDLEKDLWEYTSSAYRVHSTDEKVYIESAKGCLARFCNVSAEFYKTISTEIYQTYTWIDKCTFKEFQEEALKRGFVVEDKHCPEWAK
jgi:hypothetical protein